MWRLVTVLLFFLLQQTATADLTKDPAWPLYDRYCLACHGSAGDGKGPAAPWLWPRPRDFTSGNYKWRSTGLGEFPTLRDLQRTIRYGVPGTSMHGFGDVLSDKQILAIAQLLYRFFPEPEAIPSNRAQRTLSVPDDWATAGMALYQKLGCASCHGPAGAGDGMAAKNLRDSAGLPAAPYAWQAFPLRRPRASDSRTDRTNAIYLSIRNGLGTMPGYKGSTSDKELMALAGYVNSLMTKRALTFRERVQVAAPARTIDQKNRTTAGGFWAGTDKASAQIFGGPVPLQPPPSRSLTPAQRSLSAQQCSRCHAKQRREWNQSLHGAAYSPGLHAQILALERDKSYAAAESCMRCHGPLAEQLPNIRAAHGGPAKGYSDKHAAYDEQLRNEGITCAACHIRARKKFGPVLGAPAATGLLPLENVVRQPLAIYERGDFCVGCHQLPPRNGIAAQPLLNTYREWLEGPYMRRGVQCQHCHMPNREHTWLGVHDPATFKQGLQVKGIAKRAASGIVSYRVRLINAGAGHYLPTTPTPAVFVRTELVDAEGDAIAGTALNKRIGRHLIYDKRWRQVEDTRIPPGEHTEMASGFKGGRVDEAAFVKVTVSVWPDEYYERFYRNKLSRDFPANEHTLYRKALEKAEGNRYSYSLRIPLSD